MRRLRLRDRASLLVLSVAVAIGGLLSQVAATANLDRDALITVETDRTAQLGLAAYAEAISSQRLALQAYLLSKDPRHLDTYGASAALVVERENELSVEADRAGVDPRSLQAAAHRWQAWADGVAATAPASLTAVEVERGEDLFTAVQSSREELGTTLGSRTARAVAAGADRSVIMTVATPALGALLLTLLLLLWWHVVRSILGPVDKLADAARAISRGASAEIPGLDREDELGQLAQALAAWRREAAHRLDLANTVAAEKERQARTLELLNDAATTTSGVLEPAVLGRILVEKSSLLLRGAEAMLLRPAPDDRLEIVAWSGPDSAPTEPPAAGKGVIGECFRSGSAIVVEDYVASPLASTRGRRLGVRSAAAVPLASGDRLVGVLAAFTRQELRLGQHDVQVLALLAAQAAPALDAARLHTELVRAHRELTKSIEDLAQASRHKSDFLASMSHELRTPLNAILGFSELLLDRDERTVDPRKRARFLRHINNNGTHLLNLINDVLDLAKVEAGQMELRVTPFDLAGLVASVLSTVEPLAAKSGIQLRSRCTDPLSLKADEDKLRQMLLNLLSNAIKFTPEGGRVEVEACRRAGSVVVAVSDTGTGIARDDQGRIFEEFTQVAGRGDGRGTGLGLPLTRRLAELHGGRVWVESELGRGSTFFLELPAAGGEDELVEPSRPRPAEPIAQPIPARGGSR